jgi:hypothetical protein
MNLAQVIHQRWALADALDELLPASRVFTGMNVNPAMPLAVITRESDRPIERFSDGSALDAIEVRIHVFHDDLDAGEAIVHQIKLAFDNTHFDLAGADKVLHMRRVNDWRRQGDDGAWQFVLDFQCTVQLTLGV